MHRKLIRRTVFLLAFSSVLALAFAAMKRTDIAQAATNTVTQGSLQGLDANGKPLGLCPLKRTDVKAEISGFLSRVVVTQEFANPFKEKIEAVYTFPLPQAAAVDDMTMRVGTRVVRGRIMRSEQAQAVYESAKAGGQVASLLDQNRPNIFTQAVANILPGEQVTITISYIETLKYEDGSYEFVFPMVVAPRYIPGTPINNQKRGEGRAPDTDRVPDASRITPPVAAEGTRAGHDISIEIALDAGVLIDELKSKSHEINVEKLGDRQAVVKLKNQTTIPNKDFILRYDVANRRIEDAVLTHRSDKGGFFTLILQPPDRVTVEDVTPKEIVFVLDTSGSMEGFPIEKAKEAMKLALDGLYPQDTFNLITFSGDTHILFPQPVAATKENLRKAQSFLASREGSGGTEMMKAIRAALDPSDALAHIRIVCFMTDGHVGNDMEIISEVQKHPKARVFAFGIGSSINRFLLDKMAEHGRGEVEYVALNDDGSAAARHFHERVRNPLLTDISIDWGALPVADVYPQCIPDLFSAKPVILSGRYTKGGRGAIRLKGKMSGRGFTREITVDLPESQPQHDVLATLWARTRVDDLMGQDYNGIQQGNARDDVRETITQLGLEYRLLTQFTSFVAVEEIIVTDGGAPRRIEVPVELPEGMSHAGGFNRGISNLPVNGRSYSNSITLSSGVLNTTIARSVRHRTPARKVRVSSGRGGNAGGGGAGGVGGGGGGGRETGTQSASAGKLPQASPTPATSLGVATVNASEVVQVSPDPKPPMKLHPSIAALIERLKNQTTQPSTDEAKFVRDGKAEIQVWLADKSEETLTQLKQLGFEIVLDQKSSKLIIGRVPIEKLAALVELKSIRYVAPQMAGG